ncbi:Isochorismate synthase MenF [Streptomyces violaceorubidus]
MSEATTSVTDVRTPAGATVHAHRDPNVLRWVAAYTASMVGDMVFFLALSWAAVQNGTPAQAGVVTAVSAVPRALLMLGGGVVADRLGPRRVVIGSDTVRCVTVLAVAAVLFATDPGLWLLALLAVAMLGWMDDEALHRTLTTGRCTYWSRSRREYWVKGDTSGHFQWVKVGRPGLRRRHRARQGRPGGRRLPHRHAHLLRRRCAPRRRRGGRQARRGSVGSAAMDDMDLETFRKLAADRRVIPVSRKLLADGDTPVALYRKLAAERPGTFLLESAENGRSWSRYSFVGVRSAATLTEKDGQAHWRGTPPVGVPTDGDPLAALRATVQALHTPRDLAEGLGLPPFTGGMVGYLGYDIVRRLEKVGPGERDDLKLPELTMLLTSDLAVMDHWEGSVLLIANAINHNDLETGVDEAYADAIARLDVMEADLTRAVAQPPAALPPSELPEYTALWGGPDFQDAVEDIKERIRAGEAFQVVPSQRFETPCTASALDVYRVLRATNPSPYMYLLRLDGFDVVGSSPEALVKVEDGRAMVHPIAGTRPRGATPQEDQALAEELLADPKERAEHLMLVDLGRNDLGRVCEPGSVEVVDFMSVERYSHVMHIVSTVTGRVAPDRTAFDVLTACFPAGTLSGAPKPRALQIIDELEPSRRGLYGGCVGYLDFAGDSDTAIAIRTALLRDGTAYVQAGAGVVADSDPVAEDTECRNKAAAVLRAVHTANRLAQ